MSDELIKKLTALTVSMPKAGLDPVHVFDAIIEIRRLRHAVNELRPAVRRIVERAAANHRDPGAERLMNEMIGEAKK